MARETGRQVLRLWRCLDPEHWPLTPSMLPPGTALVGGAVRDALLGRLAPRPDLDFVVDVDAVALTRSLARRHGGTCVVLDPERSIARLVIAGWTIDLARCSGGGLLADLARRDFRINAIALPLSPGTAAPVDPHGGMEDLRQRRIAAIAEANLLADPLRLLRGIRLSVELDFAIEGRTWAWIRRHRNRLGGVAGERILAELERIAAAPAGACGLQRIGEIGLLESFREPACRRDPAPAAAARLERLDPSRVEELGLTPGEAARALPPARLALALEKDQLRRLHASRQLQERCDRIRSWWEEMLHTCTGPPSLDCLPEQRRLALHRALEQDLPALLLLLDPERGREALHRWRDPADPLFHPRCPLDGHRLQELLGLSPGRDLGRLMEHLTREVAFGRLPPSPDSAAAGLRQGPGVVLAEARRWLAGQGIRHDG